MAFSGDQTPRASGQTGRGPGSQRRSLVRRGQRSAMAVRRDAPSRLVGDSPSGAEASSGPPDTCRSTGRGVEEATGIPPAGTPGNRGFHTHIPYRTLLSNSDSAAYHDSSGVFRIFKRRVESVTWIGVRENERRIAHRSSAIGSVLLRRLRGAGRLEERLARGVERVRAIEVDEVA